MDTAPSFLKILLVGSQASETEAVAIRFLPVSLKPKDNKHCFCSYRRDRLLEKDLHSSADSLAVPALGESLYTARGSSWFLAPGHSSCSYSKSSSSHSHTELPAGSLLRTASERQGSKSYQLGLPGLKGERLQPDPRNQLTSEPEHKERMTPCLGLLYNTLPRGGK